MKTITLTPRPIHALRRILLVLAVLIAPLTHAVAEEYSVELNAGKYTQNSNFPNLDLYYNGETVGNIHATSLYTSAALINKKRNFKLIKDSYMEVTVKKGYVIKELYVWNQTKGGTFVVADTKISPEMTKNYFSGTGTNSYGLYLREDGNAVQTVCVKAPADDDMEFENIKVTFQKENPVAAKEQSRRVVCLDSTPFEYSGLPSGYNGRISFQSDDTSVATVDGNGFVTTHKVGTAKIYAIFGEYGYYGQKRIGMDVTVSQATIAPRFEHDDVSVLSDAGSTVNALVGIPYGYNGKVTFTLSDNSAFSVADPRTGRLTVNARESGYADCTVTATFSSTDSFNDASCQYRLHVYAVDEEGYVTVGDYEQLQYYGRTAFLQDKKLRLSNDIYVMRFSNSGLYQWEKTFSGEFDGAGHSITLNGRQVGNGFFTKTENATIRNLRVVGNKTDPLYGVAVENRGQFGHACAAVLVCEAAGSTTLRNVSVDSGVSAINNYPVKGFGSLVAYVPEGSCLEIDDCLVNCRTTKLRNDAGADRKVWAFVAQSEGETRVGGSLYIGDLPDGYALEAAGGNAATANSCVAGNGSDARLKSGEAAWRLQGGRETMVWGQKLPSLDDATSDDTPLLTSDASRRVCRLTPAVAPEAAVMYANGEEPQLQADVSAAGYATYFNSFAYQLPSQLKAFTVSSAADGAIALSEITDGVVPAMTAVLLQSTSGGAATARLTLLPSDTRQPIAGGDNLLRGSDTPTMTHAGNGAADSTDASSEETGEADSESRGSTDASSEETSGADSESGGSTDASSEEKGGADSESRGSSSDGTLYYKFAYGRSGTADASRLGFWWGAAEGAAFLSGAHKAWLALPQQAGARPSVGFAIGADGSTTGINAVSADNAANANASANASANSNSSAPTYTLGGIRMSGTPMRPGIYVRGGKKIVVGK